MPRATDAIRIRASARDGVSEKRNPREAFWAPLLNLEKVDRRGFPQDISQLEARLCREFGGELRSALLDHLSKGLHIIDSEFLPSGLRNFERSFYRYIEFQKEDRYGYQFIEAFTRYLEYRQEILRENTALRKTQEQIAAAGSLFFSTRILGYASITFDLSVGSFSQLATTFDGNFDSFRVFLDAFVPVAFGQVFDQDFADSLDFAVSIPSSVEQAFDAAAAAAAAPAAMQPVAPPPVNAASVSADRQRAEWLWRLANGSLLIPVVITIAVLFYGAHLLLDIRNSQNAALQPILQHQLELLREDRLRMTNQTSQSAAPAATAPSALAP